jgi:hypothetical protein
MGAGGRPLKMAGQPTSQLLQKSAGLTSVPFPILQHQDSAVEAKAGRSEVSS